MIIHHDIFIYAYDEGGPNRRPLWKNTLLKNTIERTTVCPRLFYEMHKEDTTYTQTEDPLIGGSLENPTRSACNRAVAVLRPF